MSELLHFAEHRLQEVALVIMAVVYTTRLVWLFRFRAGRDRQPATGRATTSPILAAPTTSPRKGGLYSLGNIFMPWAMESTRTRPFFYAQFVIFHLGVTANILLSFLIPYVPSLLASATVVLAFQTIIGAAFVVGCMRMVRRITKPVMRAISTPDDYFSLTLLTVWFLCGVLAAPNQTQGGETHLLLYFFITAFFLIYVPFSKISHYLYYPFTRYWLGRTLGHRGVFPMQPVLVPAAARPTEIEAAPTRQPLPAGGE
jgi:nitrate reductase gamma subunit